ncbi:MAG: hypothetical protein ACFCD0_25610 [Gemmataceae bacterium]
MNESKWKTCDSPRVLLHYLCEKLLEDRHWKGLNCWEAMARFPQIGFVMLASWQRVAEITRSQSLAQGLRMVEQRLEMARMKDIPDRSKFIESLPVEAAKTVSMACGTHVALTLGRLREQVGSMAQRQARFRDERNGLYQVAFRNEARIQSDIIRDVFGNPFHPLWKKGNAYRSKTNVQRWAQSNNGTVVKMTQTIDQERRFELIPILADALEEDGCNDADILDHCRNGKPHVRGCWVVELFREQP